jgi:hypothetical protein
LKALFPYQNYSLVNLPKERWKDIPAFEGLYKISNYGRIKSLPRETEMNTPQGGSYTSQEKIRKSKLEVKLNKTIQQNLYTVIITLYRDGITYHYSVPRLVYNIFKKPFDLDDKTIFISYKDGDGRNTHVDNLVKSDISTIKLASYKKGRAISHLTVLSKPVTQFDMEGNPIASFPSMYEAGKITGFGGRNIAEVVSGKVHMYKGFFWKEGIHKRKLNLGKIERNVTRETIHTSLKKRLRLRNVDPDNLPPFLNLSTESMPGERWKDAPGYEGLYKVSNYGRGKALQKITYGKQQKWMPEQIQRLTVDFRIDANGKEVPGSTFVCMAKEGKKRVVSIPRLVYYLFVKEFDLHDANWRIYYKDGNSLNLNANNLLLKRGVWSFSKIKKSIAKK